MYVYWEIPCCLQNAILLWTAATKWVSSAVEKTITQCHCVHPTQIPNTHISIHFPKRKLFNLLCYSTIVLARAVGYWVLLGLPLVHPDLSCLFRKTRKCQRKRRRILNISLLIFPRKNIEPVLSLQMLIDCLIHRLCLDVKKLICSFR